LGAEVVLVTNNAEPTLALLTSRSTVAANGFTTASTFCRQVTLSFLTGFEYGPISGLGPFDAVATTGGVPTAEAAVKRSGSYAAKISKSALGSSAVTKTLSGGVLVARVAVYLDSLPSSNVAQLASVGVSAGSAANLRYSALTKKLELAFGATSGVATATSTVSAATWYLVDLKVDVTANPRTASWRLDGVAQPSASVAEAAATATGMAIGSSVATDVFSAHFDDLVIASAADSYPIGDGRVLALGPNASPLTGHAGAGAFQYETGSAIDAGVYGRLAEVPLVSSADFVKQVNTSAVSYLEMGLQDTTSSCIHGVRAMVALHASGSGANVAVTRIYDGTTATVVSSGSVGSTSLIYKSAMVTAATQPWSSSALNGLVARIGYSNDVNPVPYWDALQLEYDAGA
jgi:hypothetical protein